LPAAAKTVRGHLIARDIAIHHILISAGPELNHDVVDLFGEAGILDQRETKGGSLQIQVASFPERDDGKLVEEIDNALDGIDRRGFRFPDHVISLSDELQVDLADRARFISGEGESPWSLCAVEEVLLRRVDPIGTVLHQVELAALSPDKEGEARVHSSSSDGFISDAGGLWN
jgi:hypothetical protein